MIIQSTTIIDVQQQHNIHVFLWDVLGFKMLSVFQLCKMKSIARAAIMAIAVMIYNNSGTISNIT